MDRGLPICHYYIHNFLQHYRSDIQGRVLEIGDATYTNRFGGEQVHKSDVLHVVEGNPQATIIGDLTSADHIPSDLFDCIICTQTLLCIYDVRAALQTLYRILKPGGVLLVSVPGISPICRYDMDCWGDYWRFTTASIKRLFSEFWLPENLTIEAHGNVMTAVAYLHGLSSHELPRRAFSVNDPDYEVLITVRSVK